MIFKVIKTGIPNCNMDISTKSNANIHYLSHKRHIE